MGEKTRCHKYNEAGCADCKCIDVDLVQAIQDIVDEAEGRIAAGRRFMGRTVCLDDGHLARIGKSVAREIEMIKAGVPFCQQFDYREGRFRDQVLMPRPEWLQVA